MKHLLLFLLLICAITANSQISVLRSGMPGAFLPAKVLQIQDSGYLQVKKEDVKFPGKTWNSFRQQVSIIKYDKNFKKINEVMLLEGANIFSGYFGELLTLGGKFWFIYLEGQESGSKEMGDIKAIAFDPNTLTTSVPKTVIPKAMLRYEIFNFHLHFVTRKPAVDKAVALYIRLTGKDYFIASFDEELTLKWSKKETLEMGGYDDQLKGLSSMEMTDDGTVYIGQTLKPSVSYSIYSPTGRLMRKTVSLGEGEPKEVLFRIDNGEVLAYGTYLDGDYGKGVYSGKLNSSGALTGIKKTEFPSTVVEPLKKEGWAKTKQKNYGIEPVYGALPVRNMKQVYGFTAEFYYDGQPYNRAGSILYAVFANNEVKIGRAPKYWTGYGFGGYLFEGEHHEGCYYYVQAHGDKMILLYYDNPNNVAKDLSDDADVLKPASQVLVAAIVDKDGNIKRQLVNKLSLSDVSVSGSPVADGYIRVPVNINKADALVDLKLQ